MKNIPEKKEYSIHPLRPTGDMLADYEGWKNWSNAQWAWEFLRRNPGYDKLCLEIGSKKDDAQADLAAIPGKADRTGGRSEAESPAALPG